MYIRKKYNGILVSRGIQVSFTFSASSNLFNQDTPQSWTTKYNDDLAFLIDDALGHKSFSHDGGATRRSILPQEKSIAHPLSKSRLCPTKLT